MPAVPASLVILSHCIEIDLTVSLAGNFFFAGARTFFRSMDAAIFLFSRVARLPSGSSVLPAISTEERIILGAELADGTRLRGQNQISHPPVQPGIVAKGGALQPPPLKELFVYSASAVRLKQTSLLS